MSVVRQEQRAAEVIPSDLREEMTALSLQALWESAHNPFHGPDGQMDNGHCWYWRDMRKVMYAAGEISSPEVVERRVVLMVNPRTNFAQGEATVGTITSCMQLLKPGEQARAHRHSMNAIRFVLEADGRGASTIVDGKELAMERGDLILTPAWCWHAHQHESSRPIVWLDVLDLSLHRYLNTEQFQPGPVITDFTQHSESLFTSSMMVPELTASTGDYSPVFRYPWAEAKRAVEAAPVRADGTRYVRYVNPVSGQSCLTTLDMGLMQVEAGTSSTPSSLYADRVLCIVEGSGTAYVGNTPYRWGENEVITVPGGRPLRLEADGAQPARIFVVSNAPIFDQLKLRRRELS